MAGISPRLHTSTVRQLTFVHHISSLHCMHPDVGILNWGVRILMVPRHVVCTKAYQSVLVPGGKMRRACSPCQLQRMHHMEESVGYAQRCPTVQEEGCGSLCPVGRRTWKESKKRGYLEACFILADFVASQQMERTGLKEAP